MVRNTQSEWGKEGKRKGGRWRRPRSDSGGTTIPCLPLLLRRPPSPPPEFPSMAGECGQVELLDDVRRMVLPHGPRHHLKSRPSFLREERGGRRSRPKELLSRRTGASSPALFQRLPSRYRRLTGGGGWAAAALKRIAVVARRSACSKKKKGGGGTEYACSLTLLVRLLPCFAASAAAAATGHRASNCPFLPLSLKSELFCLASPSPSVPTIVAPPFSSHRKQSFAQCHKTWAGSSHCKLYHGISDEPP